MPVSIKGVQETLKDIRKFDPDLQKQMNKQIKNVMVPIRNKARGYAPANSQMLSGWTSVSASEGTAKYRAFPKYNQSEVTDGIVYRAGNNKQLRNGWQIAHFIANNSAAGAIYETAGRINPNGRATSHVVASRHRFDKKYSVSSGTRVDNNSLNPNAGKQFLEPLGQLYGDRGSRDPRMGGNQRGRLIFRAWSEDQGRATHAVNLAINVAVAQFNAKNIPGTYGLAA